MLDRPDNPDPIRYYVALDLGSESMAAYYQIKDGIRGHMINMQAHGRTLLGSEPLYLMSDDGKAPSPRLRTRISLEDNRQGEWLDDGHALLDFCDGNGNKLTGYDESLFAYFYKKYDELGRNIMPNPKIPFQEGGQDIIPEVEVKGTYLVGRAKKKRHSPEILLKHLTVQVVRNFVLKSPELKDVPPHEIHLTLTVPNVYSLTHAESIREFVEEHTGVGKVEALYESDAVAYFALHEANDSPEFRKFNNSILDRSNQALLHIVTIDIGRGTTDLSLIQIRDPKLKASRKKASEKIPRQHFVNARTGKGDGGNRLSYIFAKYYNDRLDEMADRFLQLTRQTPAFNFLQSPASRGAAQSRVLQELETLIEYVKRSFTHDYRIGLTRNEQIEMITPLLDRIFEAADPNWKQNAGFEQLRKEMQEAFLLPKIMPGEMAKILSYFHIATSWLRKHYGPNIGSLLALKEDLKSYVEENVVNLIKQLKEMAEKRENKNGKKGVKIFDPENTFVLVAGQASQFKPIARAIIGEFKDHDFPEDQIHFLKGSQAKDACCKGAVIFQRAGNTRENPEELHGTYGLLSVATTNREDHFKAVNMTSVSRGGKDNLTFTAPTQYFFIYSPRPSLSKDEPPGLHDGSTALIKTIRGSDFEIEYDPSVPVIKVNGEAMDKIASFGDINESIYPKVWPEALEPEK